MQQAALHLLLLLFLSMHREKKVEKFGFINLEEIIKLLNIGI